MSDIQDTERGDTMQKLKLFIVAIAALVVASCGGPKVEVINLNKVLDVMVATLNTLKKENKTEKKPEAATAEEKKKFMETFNERYITDLNNAKLMSKPLATRVNADGSITGFEDINKNKKYDIGEKDLFKIVIDSPNKRLIAMDLQGGYRRSTGFSMGGFVAGMVLGHMLSGQTRAGISPNRYSNMQMSPKNYHSSAVSRAKARAKSRSRSGSFSRGK